MDEDTHESNEFLAEVFEVAVEGFCKMFLADVCTDASIVADLLTLLFDPEISAPTTRTRFNGRDAAVIQALTAFFPRFAYTVRSFTAPLDFGLCLTGQFSLLQSRAHQHLVVDAFAATMRRFCFAPRSSPLQNAALDQLVPFLLDLTNETKLVPAARQQRLKDADSMFRSVRAT